MFIATSAWVGRSCVGACYLRRAWDRHEKCWEKHFLLWRRGGEKRKKNGEQRRAHAPKPQETIPQSHPSATDAFAVSGALIPRSSSPTICSRTVQKSCLASVIQLFLRRVSPAHTHTHTHANRRVGVHVVNTKRDREEARGCGMGGVYVRARGGTPPPLHPTAPRPSSRQPKAGVTTEPVGGQLSSAVPRRGAGGVRQL